MEINKKFLVIKTETHEYPRLTKGILVIFSKKCTLGAPVSERVTLSYSGCSRGPIERKKYFWIFQGPARKLRVDKILYQHLPLSVWLSQSMSPKAKQCLISTAKVSWHVIGFSPLKSGTLPNALGKHRLGPHPFKSQTSKPPMHTKPWKPIPKSCFYYQSLKIKVFSK